jgi:inner membrane protein
MVLIFPLPSETSHIRYLTDIVVQGGNRMATLYTHVAVGLGMARICAARPMPWAYWGLAAVLPMIPDLDVFSTANYGTPLGHRGITHSLLFAQLLGMIAAGLVFRTLRVRWWLLAAVFFGMVASHGLLDAMTRGGEGVPSFWPLQGRFGNWGPLAVSDIAFSLPDPRHSRAMRSELLWVWLPTGLLVGVVTACRWHRTET